MPPADARLATDWRRRVQALSAPMRDLLAEVCAERGAAAADHFYGHMLDDPRATRFLSAEQVGERLRPALQRWLRDLMAAVPEQIDTFYAQQEHVGHVHARIGIPVDLAGRGARMLKDDMRLAIRTRAGTPEAAL